MPRECAPTKVSGISFVEIWRRLTAHEATQRRPRKYAKGPLQVGVVSRLARASAQDRLRANEDFRPRLRGALSRSRRDLAIRAVAALNAHGAAHRRTRKYAKGPMQVGVVSPPARAPGQDGVRDNEGFRPRFRGAIARSRRDLAICAVAALPTHGAAHRRTRKYPKGPIQVDVVSHPMRAQRTSHTHACEARNHADLYRTICVLSGSAVRGPMGFMLQNHGHPIFKISGYRTLSL